MTTPLIQLGQGSYTRTYTPRPYFVWPRRIAEAARRLSLRFLAAATCRNEVCDNDVEGDSGHPDFCADCVEAFPGLVEEFNQERRQEEREQTARDDARGLNNA